MKSPLSQAQAGVYYACETSVSDEYNYQNPVLFALPDDADLAKLQQAVQDALCAHPYLFSHVVVNDEGVPEIESGEVTANVPIRELNEEEWKAAQETFAKTMDIHGDKLYRAEIYTVHHTPDAVHHFLYIDLHHVLADGFSVTLLLRDIERLYNGKRPAGEMLDGAAIATAEAEQRANETLMGEAKQWYSQTFCDAADTDSLPIPERKRKAKRHKPKAGISTLR